MQIMFRGCIYEAAEGKYEIPSFTSRKFKTNIPPEKRSLKNLPRDSKGKPKVKFQDWLGMKTTTGSVGKGTDGKWYGWSHRAVYGFSVGEKVKEGDVIYSGKEYTIKTDDEAHEAAKKFASEVS